MVSVVNTGHDNYILDLFALIYGFENKYKFILLLRISIRSFLIVFSNINTRYKNNSADVYIGIFNTSSYLWCSYFMLLM